MHAIRVGALATIVASSWMAGTSHAQVKLERKWPEGAKLTYETVVKVEQVMSIMGMDIETQTEQTVTSSYNVGKRRDDGNLPVESKVESMKASFSLPGGINFDYDSTQENQAADPPFDSILDAMDAAAKTQYTIVFDKDLKVSAIEGAEKLLDQLQQKNPDVAELLKSTLSAEGLKQRVNEEFSTLPPALVRPGESWTSASTQDLGGGQKLTFERTYTYEGTEQRDGKTLDKITSKSNSVRYEQDPNAAGPAKVTASDLKIESSEGLMLFDRESGKVVENKESNRMVGTMTISVAGQELETNLELTISSSTVAK